MNVRTLSAALAASLFVPLAASAAIIVDGAYDADYGMAKAVVTYLPGAPEGNFGGPFPNPQPTQFTDAIGYSIYSAAEDGEVYVFLKASGPVASVGPFANLYFDIDPQNMNGSDILFGINSTSVTAIVAGTSSGVTAPGAVAAVSADGTGIEVSIPNADFTGPIAGLTYSSGQVFASVGSPVVLRLSQSFGYSVAGGATYGADRLGAVTLVPPTAVPEPASWAMMLIGFAGIGAVVRRRVSGVVKTA